MRIARAWPEWNSFWWRGQNYKQKPVAVRKYDAPEGGRKPPSGAGDEDSLSTERSESSTQASSPAEMISSLTASEIQRRVMRKVMRSGWIWRYPLGLISVLATHALLFGVSLGGLVASVALAFVGLGTFAYRFLYRGPEYAKKVTLEFREALRRAQLEEITTITQTLTQRGADEHARRAREFKDAFEELVEDLKAQANDPLRRGRSTRYRDLAEENFLHGIAILKQAGNLHEALEESDVTTHRGQRTRLEKKLANEEDEANRTRFNQLTRLIELHERREQELDQAMNAVDALTTAFNEAKLEIAAELPVGVQAAALHNGAPDSLTLALQAARRVEDRLNKPAHSGADDDQVYLEAARQRTGQ